MRGGLLLVRACVGVEDVFPAAPRPRATDRSWIVVGRRAPGDGIAFVDGSVHEVGAPRRRADRYPFPTQRKMSPSARAAFFQLILATMAASANLFGGGGGEDVPSASGPSFPKDQRIINGYRAPEGRYPYAVSLQGGSGHFCGGSLIANNVVLTAAHCIDGDRGDFFVRIGTDEKYEGGELIPTKDTMLHPEYNGVSSDGFDMGLVVLGRPTSLDVPVVRLNPDGEYPRAGTRSTTMGWGDMDASAVVNTADELMAVDMSVISTEECESVYNRVGLLEKSEDVESMVCTYEDKKGACQGDSGGALVVRGDDAESDTQFGIVSWGIGCANFPAVFGRVSRGYEWIRSRACDESSDPPLCGTLAPTRGPTGSPTTAPPTRTPTRNPSRSPTLRPTDQPTTSPTKQPTASPTTSPTAGPTKQPTASPSYSPTESPTISPTSVPSFSPTESLEPTASPSQLPSFSSGPTSSPSLSAAPSSIPSTAPTMTTVPTSQPSSSPSFSSVPSSAPSSVPSSSAQPTEHPSVSAAPSSFPSSSPSVSALPTISAIPSAMPSMMPSSSPSTSAIPSAMPSSMPSSSPSDAPSTTTSPTMTLSPTATVRPSISAAPSSEAQKVERSDAFRRVGRSLAVNAAIMFVVSAWLAL
ncbi:hypothetical protein ACHAWF_007905 [Thalassiosira exigua]